MAPFWLNSKKVLGARVRQTDEGAAGQLLGAGEGATGRHCRSLPRADLYMHPRPPHRRTWEKGRKDRDLFPGVDYRKSYSPRYVYLSCNFL